MALRLRLYLLLFGPTFPTRWLLEIPDSKTTTSRSQKKAARLFPQRFRKKTGFDFNWPPSRRDPLLHQLLYCISLTKPRRSAHPWNWENPLYPRYEQSMGGVHKRKAGSHSYWQVRGKQQLAYVSRTTTTLKGVVPTQKTLCPGYAGVVGIFPSVPRQKLQRPTPPGNQLSADHQSNVLEWAVLMIRICSNHLAG